MSLTLALASHWHYWSWLWLRWNNSMLAGPINKIIFLSDSCCYNLHFHYTMHSHTSWNDEIKNSSLKLQQHYPRWPSGTNTFSLHLADTSFAIYVGCQPVPALQPSTNFLIFWPTPALQYMLVVGLSQLYSHQYTFLSSGQPQLCNMCWLSACPSFTANPKFSHHPADLSFAIYVVCRPVPALRAWIHSLIIRLTPVFLYCWLSACPTFTGMNSFF